MFTADLAEFTAGDDITVYVAIDDRVIDSIQSWLKDWKNTGVTMRSSNDVNFVLYKKNVNEGETVVLGTNGGLGLSANYSVFAVEKEKVIKGDVDCDGRITVFDMCQAREGIADGFNNTLSAEAADIDSSGEVDSVVFPDL